MKISFFLKTLFTTMLFSFILFLSAWKINYLQGFIFLGTNLFTGFMNFWIIRNDEELMKERSKVGEGAKSWDKIILGISGVTYLISLVIAGLDSGNFQWSPKFHWILYLVGVIITIIGQIIFLAARKENKFFSSVIRIQTDRGHRVCDSGIYKFVRHPGYLGMSISLIALPLITGSVWSFIPIAVAEILLIIRTYYEDKTLIKELMGYSDYTKKTKFRLLPNIW